MTQSSAAIAEAKRLSRLAGLERLAWLMDRSFQIPGTRVTVGLDALLGLIPVGGDVLTGIVQVGIVLIALFVYRVPRAVASRMAANVMLDVTVGAVPILGDVFDIFFKANTKNLQLLTAVEEQRAQALPVATAPSWLFLGLIAFMLVATVALALVGFVVLAAWLWQRPLI